MQTVEAVLASKPDLAEVNTRYRSFRAKGMAPDRAIVKAVNDYIGAGGTAQLQAAAVKAAAARQPVRARSAP